MRLICGADGCKGGWVAIFKDLDSGRVSPGLFRTARELIYSDPIPQVIAIDIPIGLPERGPRACDLEARRRLGPGRGSSVFPAPVRPVLAATTYENACEKRSRIEQKRLSIQSWAIIPKIRDVDNVLRQDPTLQARVREIHPEVCFYWLAGGRPLQHSKKELLGREERRKLLEPLFGPWLQAILVERSKLASAVDDIMDAFAALWTAERIATGAAQTLPSAPPRDTFGLRMEIVV